MGGWLLFAKAELLKIAVTKNDEMSFFLRIMRTAFKVY